jgi:hypothetical protein
MFLLLCCLSDYSLSCVLFKRLQTTCIVHHLYFIKLWSERAHVVCLLSAHCLMVVSRPAVARLAGSLALCLSQFTVS